MSQLALSIGFVYFIGVLLSQLLLSNNHAAAVVLMQICCFSIALKSNISIPISQEFDSTGSYLGCCQVGKNK